MCKGLSDFQNAVDTTPIFTANNDFLKWTEINISGQGSSFETHTVNQFEKRADNGVWENISQTLNYYNALIR